MIVNYLIFILVIYFLMSFLETTEKRSLNKSLVINEFFYSIVVLPFVFARTLYKVSKRKTIVSINNFIVINFFLLSVLFTSFYSLFGIDSLQGLDIIVSIILWLIVLYSFYLIVRSNSLSSEIYDNSQSLMIVFYIFVSHALIVNFAGKGNFLISLGVIVLLQNSIIKSVRNYILKYRNQSTLIFINFFIISLSLLSLNVFMNENDTFFIAPSPFEGLLIFVIVSFVSIFRIQRETVLAEYKKHQRFLNNKVLISNVLLFARLVLW